jgi:hypothetical protein
VAGGGAAVWRGAGMQTRARPATSLRSIRKRQMTGTLQRLRHIRRGNLHRAIVTRHSFKLPVIQIALRHSHSARIVTAPKPHPHGRKHR